MTASPDAWPPGWRGVPGLRVSDGCLETYTGYAEFFAARLVTPPDPTSDDVPWFSFETREFIAWCLDPDPHKELFEGVSGGQCFAGVGSYEVALLGGRMRYTLHALLGEGCAERRAWLEDAVRIECPSARVQPRESVN